MAAWATREQARNLWADAPLNDDDLDLYLDAAQAACEAYAPVVEGYYPTPSGYTLAVVAQARSIYTATKSAGASGEVGPDGLVIQTFPLDWQVRQLLRPKNPRPAIA